jgi:hypothetical protein
LNKKMICVCSALFLFTLAGIQSLHATEDFQEVVEATEENPSDPSAFEGDSDAMSGERAPESMPMSDAPAEGGFAIE